MTDDIPTEYLTMCALADVGHHDWLDHFKAVNHDMHISPVTPHGVKHLVGLAFRFLNTKIPNRLNPCFTSQK